MPISKPGVAVASEAIKWLQLHIVLHQGLTRWYFWTCSVNLLCLFIYTCFLSPLCLLSVPNTLVSPFNSIITQGVITKPTWFYDWNQAVLKSIKQCKYYNWDKDFFNFPTIFNNHWNPYENVLITCVCQNYYFSAMTEQQIAQRHLWLDPTILQEPHILLPISIWTREAVQLVMHYSVLRV